MKHRLGLLTTVFLWLGAVGLSAQQRTIRGTVTDEVSGGPVTFPQVSVRGTQIGTIGDENGNFVLEGVPSGDATLVVTRIGYRSEEVPVAAGASTVNASLTVDYLQVEELVVTGRATETARINLPNSVETVSGAELEQVPQETIDKALQGRVTGAVIASNSGAPGGGIQLNLRGSSSVNAASEPLYVIDGVVVSNVGIPSNQNEITDAAGGSNPSLDQDVIQNRIADINPDDIASIEILKGASAAAIYGSKASNGVVIITTKRGEAGRTRARLSLAGGFFDLSNTLGSRVFTSVDEAVSVFGPDAAEHFEPGVVYDNEEALAGGNELSYNLNGSVSGGSEDVSFFGSGQWRNEEGIISGTGFERQSGRINLSTNLGDRASVNLNTNVLRTNASRGITNNDNSSVSYYMVFPGTPNFIDLRANEDGLFPPNVFALSGSNPLQTAALVGNDEEVWRVITSANADVDVFQNDAHRFSVLANVGADYFNQENRIFSPPEAFFEPVDGFLGTVSQSNADNLNFAMGVNGVWEWIASEDLTSTTSVGLQYEKQDITINRVVGRDLTGGKDKTDAAVVTEIVENSAQIEDFGFYVQEEVLTFDDRLLLVGAVRFDQSSTNGDPTDIFIYPKAAASYRIPTEGLFDEIKVRAAVGQTGNQPLCEPRTGCQKFTSLRLDQNIEGIPTFQLEGSVGSDFLEPERMTEFEAGVDITGLDGRGTLELTGFIQNISNLILERTTAPSTGFANQFINGGALRKWGIETALAITPVRTGALTWISRTSFFFNRSEVTRLDVPAFEADAGFGLVLGGFFVEEGSSLTQIVGVEAACTADPAVDDPALECRSVPGLAKFGDTEPDFTMTFSNELRFGDLSLYGLLEWRKGQDVINLTQLLYDFSQNTEDFTQPGGGGERLQVFGASARPWTQSGSFLKAREVSLTYDVPGSISGSLFGGFFDTMRIRASARNLFTITDYVGLDPEVSNFGSQQVGRSIDVAPFPPSRSFWLGIDLSL